jgi:cytosine/adenosine deaminase-related metal-dependent hydrolase
MAGDLHITAADVLVAPGDLRERHDVRIEAGAVVAVEPAGTTAPTAEVLDGAGLLAMPGLVNVHTHSPENPLRGLADGLPLEPWLAHLMGQGGLYDADDHYWCALATAVEGLRGGTTSVLDHLWMTPPTAEAIDAAMRAYRDAGVRAGVAPLLDDVDWYVTLAADHGIDVGHHSLLPLPPFLPTDELLGLTDDAMARWHGTEDGRLRVLAGPGGVQWASDELMCGLAALARKYESALQIHLLETRLQDIVVRRRYGGRSGVEALDALGVLGPGVSLAHSVWIDDDDIARIADRGAIVAHNPAANLRLRSGRAPVPALLEAGVDVAIGTDGAASSDDQSTWMAMRLAALVHREPGAWVSTGQALTMATKSGGRALGVAGLGTLEAGAPGDLALLDLGHDGLAGAYALEPSLVLSERGEGVRHAVVAGEVVLRDRRCTRVDEDEVRAALAAQVDRRRAAGDLGTAARLAGVAERLRVAAGVA